MLIVDLAMQYEDAKKNGNNPFVSPVGLKNSRITHVLNKENTYNSKIYSEKHHVGLIKLNIGPYCSIALQCKFLLSGNHDWQRVTTYLNMYENNLDDKGLLSNGDITLEGDNWIGLNSTIMSGVKLGVGSIVAANSTVTKDVEPYSIVGGSPAKHIKYRFNEEQISQLLKTKWWMYDLAELKDIQHLLFSHDIDEFIKEFKLITNKNYETRP
jgi:acetyltransferase-like isoleucine patch superfamily enzyme